MAFLVIAEPGNDYTTGELKKIDEYLDNEDVYKRQPPCSSS